MNYREVGLDATILHAEYQREQFRLKPRAIITPSYCAIACALRTPKMCLAALTGGNGAISSVPLQNSTRADSSRHPHAGPRFAHAVHARTSFKCDLNVGFATHRMFEQSGAKQSNALHQWL
jgi:hypothetical protein